MADTTEQIDATRMPDAQSAPAGERSTSRWSELVLLIGFLTIIASVPVSQTVIEVVRGERVQFTDVFRYSPTSKNLRQYEATLEEKSWIRQKLRPEVQRLMFQILRDTGAQGVMGRDQWLFYRPDVRYLVEPDRVEGGDPQSKWVQRTAGLTHREAVLNEIVHFRDQLNERGIALLVVPIPGKPSVYPEQLTARRIVQREPFHSPTMDLIEGLRRHGVQVVDLFTTYRNFRATNGSAGAGQQLYLARDTHWTPSGARLAAEAVAARLNEHGLVPKGTNLFQTHESAVRRTGDVVGMMKIPRLGDEFAPEIVHCEQVTDPVFGPLVPTGSDRPGAYRYPGQNATVLVLGDSFCRIYQYPEPASLGELATPNPVANAGARPTSLRLLPGSSGFVSHLMLALKSPVDAIYSDGGAATDVRRKLSTNPEILEGKKLVIWEFVERDIMLGQAGWQPVPLPAKLQ